MKNFVRSLVAVVVIAIAFYSIKNSQKVAITQSSQNNQNNNTAVVQNNNSSASQGSRNNNTSTGKPIETVKPTEPVNTPKSSCDIGEGTVVLYQNSLDYCKAIIGVPIYNSGETNLYLSSATVDLKDETGHLVDSIKYVYFYPQVLQPGETAWGFEEESISQKTESALTTFPHVDVKEATVPCIRYEVSDVTISNEKFLGVEVTGQVTNTTTSEADNVEVVILLFDNDNNLISASHTNIDGTIQPGESRGFSASSHLSTYDGLKAENIKTYIVYAYPYQYQFG